jgi:hypothetical protein
MKNNPQETNRARWMFVGVMFAWMLFAVLVEVVQ